MPHETSTKHLYEQCVLLFILTMKTNVRCPPELSKSKSSNYSIRRTSHVTIECGTGVLLLLYSIVYADQFYGYKLIDATKYLKKKKNWKTHVDFPSTMLVVGRWYFVDNFVDIDKLHITSVFTSNITTNVFK